MNYLAHAYLSFNDPDLLLGNMISDYVKGKTQYNYSPAVQKGIRLHRAIDAFTDNHPATRKAKVYFQESYRLYAGAFIDVVYDHFLATDPSIFPNAALPAFAEKVYQMLEPRQPEMPDRFRAIFPYMRSQNWLAGYAELEGIGHSFRGLVRRSAYLSDAAPAIELFNMHYQSLGQYYREFMPAVHQFATDTLLQLGTND